jgi:hypothetical protein
MPSAYKNMTTLDAIARKQRIFCSFNCFLYILPPCCWVGVPEISIPTPGTPQPGDSSFTLYGANQFRPLK